MIVCAECGGRFEPGEPRSEDIRDGVSTYRHIGCRQITHEAFFGGGPDMIYELPQ